MHMSQILVNNLTFSYEGSADSIFESANFSIDTDWKLGVLGRNGKGKTTFLKLLMGQYSYEGMIASNVTFDYFPYPLTKDQMLHPAAEFIEDLKPFCKTWQVIRELSELEEEADILYRPYHLLSPGERTKILLAVLFSGENDFLLIDEPTSHLDQSARDSIQSYLASKKGFLLVSHDRELLDACIDHVLVLNRKTIEVQKGNFSSWWENKQRKDQFVAAENEKHLKEIRKLEQTARRSSEWADKNERTKIGYDSVKEHDRSISTRAYIGSKTKKMQSRVRQFEKRLEREIAEKEGLLQDLETLAALKLTPLSHHKKTLLSVKDYSLKYAGAGTPVFTDLTFTVSQGERVAVCGKNGCGKSTLLKEILRKAGSDTSVLTLEEHGGCDIASGLIISFVPQDTSSLKGALADFCKARHLEQSLFFALLRKLDFERSQFSRNMEEYSEGQKKKVLLAASLVTPAHLYIWDEPLNYIDVFSRMQIENLLMEYKPTMIFVEHDKRFCEKIATKMVEMIS